MVEHEENQGAENNMYDKSGRKIGGTTHLTHASERAEEEKGRRLVRHDDSTCS